MHEECRVLYGLHTVGACTSAPLQPTHRQVPVKKLSSQTQRMRQYAPYMVWH